MREESNAVGHAVTATYLYAGAADVYAETGEEALLAALERIWESSARRKMYVTGAVGTYHHGVSRRGDKVHEAYALDYHAPQCHRLQRDLRQYRQRHVELADAGTDRRRQVRGRHGASDLQQRPLAHQYRGDRFCYTNPLRWHGPNTMRLATTRQTAGRLTTAIAVLPRSPAPSPGCTTGPTA